MFCIFSFFSIQFALNQARTSIKVSKPDPELNWIRIEESIEISATKSEIWAYVSNFEDLAWFKSLAGNFADQNIERKGSEQIKRRFVNTLGGIRIVERLLTMNQFLNYYTYTIEKIELPNVGLAPVFLKFEAKFQVHKDPLKFENSIVNWTCRYLLNTEFISENDKLRVIGLNTYQEIIRNLYQSGLTDIKKHFELRH